jgi:hypothetical protein
MARRCKWRATALEREKSMTNSTHKFLAIGNTPNGETVLAEFPAIKGSSQLAYDAAERRCEAHRKLKPKTHASYAYVREIGYERK